MRAWTADDDDELRRCYCADATEQLARRLGRTPSAVRARAHSLGLRGSRRRWTPAEVSVLEAEYTRVPLPTLARRLRRTPHSVAGKARALGLRHTPALAAESEELLWELRAQPGVIQYFGLHFGASAAAIRRVLRRMEDAGGPQNSRQP